jgi:hypothetical protein
VLAFRPDYSRVASAEAAGTSANVTASFAGFSKLEPSILADAIRLNISDAKAASAINEWVLDYVVYRGEGFGTVEPV